MFQLQQTKRQKYQSLKKHMEITQNQMRNQIVQGYQVLKTLSYGSTSMVYRIKKRKQYPQLKSNQQQNKLNFDVRQIHIQDQPTQLNKNQEKLNKIYRFQSQYIKSEQCAQQQQQDKAPIQNQMYSAKLYSLQKIHSTSSKDIKQTIQYNILTELLLYAKFNHPGITKAYTIYSQHKKVRQIKIKTKTLSPLMQNLGIIIQSNSKGNFSALMNFVDRTKILKENKLKIIKFYAGQIVNSLSYLNQKMNILHRDVKVQNIMINSMFQLKIIDFGAAYINEAFLEKVDQNQLRLLKRLVFQEQQEKDSVQKSKKQLINDYLANRKAQKSLVGSRHYISPQMIENKKNQMFFVQNAYQKTDIWSFGVLLYKIFHYKFPFQHKNHKALLQTIQNQDITCQIDQKLPFQVKQIIYKTLKKDYTQRTTWSQIKSLNFFQGIDIQNIYQYPSPIHQLQEQQKKLMKQQAKKYQKIYFQQNMIFESRQLKKERKILIISQNQHTGKILIFKLNSNSLSEEIIFDKNQDLKDKNQQISLVENTLTLNKQNQIYRFMPVIDKNDRQQQLLKNEHSLTYAAEEEQTLQKMMKIIQNLMKSQKQP